MASIDRRPDVRRRHWPAIGGASLLLVGAASAGTWFARNGRDAPVTVGGEASSAARSEATTPSSPPGSADSLNGDALHDALVQLGATVGTAPSDAAHLGDATLCGVERRGHDITPDDGLEEQERRCFLDRHLAATPAVFIEQRPTDEGAPIVTVWRALADGTVGYHVDSTRDSYGSGSWETLSCGRLTTRFPQAPTPLPPSYFICSESPIAAVGPLDTPSAPMPAWFEERPQLPLCGYEVRIEDRDAARRACFAGAVRDGLPAEFAQLSTGDEGERSARWFRSLGDGTFEVFEWQSGGAHGATSQWLRHSCSTIEFTNEPGSEVDGLPILNGSGECVVVEEPAGAVSESSPTSSIAGAQPVPSPSYQSLSYARDDHGTRRLTFHFDGHVEDVPVAVVEDLGAAVAGQVSVGQQPQTGSATICGNQHGGTPGNVELLFPAALFGPRDDSELLDVRPIGDIEEFNHKIIACPIAGEFVQVWIALDGSPTLDTFEVVATGDTITLAIFEVPTDGPMIRHQRPSVSSGGEDALVKGVLELDQQCLYVAVATGERYAVVWPYGMRWDTTTNAVVPLKGQPMPVGALVHGGGGYYSVDDVERLLGAKAAAMAERCVDNAHGEIAIVNNYDTAIELGSS